MTSSFVTSSNKAVVIETLKPSEDLSGFICRIFEANGGWQLSNITFPLLSNDEWNVKEVNLLEEEIDETPVNKQINNENDCISFNIELNPFQIKSFLFEKK